MKIGYLEHEFGPKKPRIRVHLPEWANDQFEIIEFDEFNTFKAIGEKIGIMFVDLECYPDYGKFA